VADLRRALFFVCVAALAGALALLLAADHEGSSPAPAAPARPHFLPAAQVKAPPAADMQPAARRFLAAYLAFEAGDRHAAAALRASATPSLAHRILASAAPRPRADTARPAISGLTVTRLPGRPDLAIVTGTAHRPSGPEPFAFLFGNRAGPWLAIAPAE
jgi:hypothetical protein